MTLTGKLIHVIACFSLDKPNGMEKLWVILEFPGCNDEFMALIIGYVLFFRVYSSNRHVFLGSDQLI